ncbi:MAG TPA: ATP-dependent Clp protease adapter ClpS [Candidatus Dormibacteraeota bacterium]|nr:ATP-dependent Clp protease adapter ClpS [Candidatus Dormibacteraeota bacterium]
MPADAPVLVETPAKKESSRRDVPWNVIVWNDPITLMAYVVLVFRRLFGHDEPTATRLMLQVHHEGKAVVASQPREQAEMSVTKLHAFGLQATLARGE